MYNYPNFSTFSNELRLPFVLWQTSLQATVCQRAPVLLLTHLDVLA
jgi:hypothetical protein